ncbi:His-Xaa-Ser system radical SAM maturase HxsB [bacterium]|nr:His-Xaa-Ser system radical SAM maturase HxsB [bacterium]
MNINHKKINKNNISFFRFRKLGDNYLLTNQAGDFIFLNDNNFKKYIEGELEEDSLVFKDLAKKGFVNKSLDTKRLVKKYQQKNNFLFTGPILHILVTTLRCDQACIYCHASAKDMCAKDTDMDKKTAKASLDKIFSSPSSTIIIEFQGGEALANWPVVEYVVNRARKKAKETGKELEFSLVSNMNLMDEEKYEFLIDNKVSVSLSLDGHAPLHNKNRPNREGGNNYKNIAKWAKRFNDNYLSLEKRGYISKLASISVVSRHSLPFFKEIVDEHINLGFDEMFLRPLNPFGVSEGIWDKINYSSDEFLEFYRNTLDYVIEKNLEGVLFKERLSKFFLQKILTDTDPNMLELRSPCGAGTGQLAYNYNGDVYTCDEGRMLSMMGDESFRLGNVFQNTYEEIIDSPTVKSLCTASCLEGLPECSSCAYMPYCGTCPIYNYVEHGNIFSQMPNNERCKMNKGILDYLFEKIKDEKIKKIFEKWLK